MLQKIAEIKNRPLRVYIYYLVSKGKIKKYANEKGYMCYDTNEFEKYKANVKIGRPMKK